MESCSDDRQKLKSLKRVKKHCTSLKLLKSHETTDVSGCVIL